MTRHVDRECIRHAQLLGVATRVRGAVWTSDPAIRERHARELPAMWEAIDALVKSPKTRAGRRRLPLPAALIAELRQHLETKPSIHVSQTPALPGTSGRSDPPNTFQESDLGPGVSPGRAAFATLRSCSVTTTHACCWASMRWDRRPESGPRSIESDWLLRPLTGGCGRR